MLPTYENAKSGPSVFLYTCLLCIHLIAPTLTVSLTPGAISGDEGRDDIAFTCIPSVEEDVASPSYQYIWNQNRSPIDLSNPRITVRNI